MAAGAAAPASAQIAQPPGSIKNVELVHQLPEAANATAINFMTYGKKDRGHGRFDWIWDWFGKDKGKDVMLVTGRFGLKTYDLSNPAKPKLLDEITAEQLRLPGDPPAGASPYTFWQNEDMDVDNKRKLALLSRDPRAYGGYTNYSPGDPNPRNATNIAGVYVIDAKNPADLKLLSFEQLPTGHTTTCVNDCEWLWTGGPAPTDKQEDAGWLGGRPIIVTDLRDPRNPVGYPQKPVDLFRQDGITAYAHDVDVDDAGIAWVAGLGGTRGYHTKGLHWDPVQRKLRWATPLDPVPYAGGGLSSSTTSEKFNPGPSKLRPTPDGTAGGWMHNSWRPIGGDAPRDWRYKTGQLLLGTEEWFGPARDACRDQGKFTISSLKGSYNGEGWRSTTEQPFRMEAVGSWAPADNEGTTYPETGSCSAHYFDVDGAMVTYAWYGQGTRFLDISNPEKPIQVAYYRPDGGNVWASYLHEGYVYTADAARGVDVLRFKKGAKAASAAKKEVSAGKLSASQRKFLKAQSSKWVPDPSTGGLCMLPKY